MDGVRYTRSIAPGHQDSFLGITAFNLLTGRRHLLGVLRKSEGCRRGCRGWCSVAPVYEMLAWSLEALKEGRYPLRKHDESAWPENSPYSGLAGTPLGCRAVLCEVRGDWNEFCHSLGFQQWSSTWHPCLMCHCRQDSLHSYRGVSLTENNWGDREAGEYDAACASCEIRVALRSEAER
eukprot:13103586-Alexandrium_andersonii.AAC.1